MDPVLQCDTPTWSHTLYKHSLPFWCSQSSIKGKCCLFGLVINNIIVSNCFLIFHSFTTSLFFSCGQQRGKNSILLFGQQRAPKMVEKMFINDELSLRKGKKSFLYKLVDFVHSFIWMIDGFRKRILYWKIATKLRPWLQYGGQADQLIGRDWVSRYTHTPITAHFRCHPHIQI